MALTDPELDLLRELLEDDPTDEAFLQVGEELVRRGHWSEAEAVLTAGLDAHPKEMAGWPLLARAALECANFDVCLAALERLDTDPAASPQNAQLEILALERSGRTAEAGERIEAYLAVDPGDVVVTAARERLAAPPPEIHVRASDPFLTVDRAERFVAVGRPDRAVRIYRRILFHNPSDHGLAARLRELAAADSEWRHDDLSEELTDPGSTPPDLDMPQPRLNAGDGWDGSDDSDGGGDGGGEGGAGGDDPWAEFAPDDEITQPHPLPDDFRDVLPHGGSTPVPAPDRRSPGGGTEAGGGSRERSGAVDPDDEDTDVHPLPEGSIARVARKGSRKRRRSLINR